MNNDTLVFGDKEYVSSRRAAEITGYTKDYVGQLCRAKKLDGKLLGRNWYISLDSLTDAKADIAPEENKERKMGEIENAEKIEENIVHVKPSLREESHSIVSPFSRRFVQQYHAISSPIQSQKPTHVVPNIGSIEKKRQQENLLTHVDVVYGEGTPIFYADDAPLIPQPRKVVVPFEQHQKEVIQEKPTSISESPTKTRTNDNVNLKNNTEISHKQSPTPSPYRVASIATHGSQKSRQISVVGGLVRRFKPNLSDGVRREEADHPSITRESRSSEISIIHHASLPSKSREKYIGSRTHDSKTKTIPQKRLSASYFQPEKRQHIERQAKKQAHTSIVSGIKSHHSTRHHNKHVHSRRDNVLGVLLILAGILLVGGLALYSVGQNALQGVANVESASIP